MPIKKSMAVIGHFTVFIVIIVLTSFFVFFSSIGEKVGCGSHAQPRFF